MSYQVINPFIQFVDPTNGNPLSAGSVYFGRMDSDPKNQPANRINVYAVQDNGTETLLAQPITLNGAGQPQYSGSVKQLKVETYTGESAYCVQVFSKSGSQKGYSARVYGMIDLQSLAAVDSTVVIAGFQARQLRYIESIKDLVPVAGVLMSVKGFFSGSPTGGGEFYYDASVPKTSHNGGTIIDPVRLALWDGTKANVATLFTAGASGSGCFVRIYEGKVQPQFWGAMCGDTTVTDTPSLKKFVDFVDVEQKGFNMQGSPLLSETLVFKNIGVYKQFILDVSIRLAAAFPAGSDLVEFKGNMFGCQHVGNIEANLGTATFLSRKVRHGVVFNQPTNAGNTSRLEMDMLSMSGLRGFAWFCATNNGYAINWNRISAADCGTTPSGTVQALAVEISNRRNKTGSNGDPNQTETITISASGWNASQLLPNSSLLFVDNANPSNTQSFEIVSAIDANNIIIKPWIDVSSVATTYSLVQGGAVYQLGGDTSKTTIRTLDAITCGYGLFDNTLYGAVVTNFIAQYCGVGAKIGGYNSAQVGSTIVSGYFENNKIDYLYNGSTESVEASAMLGISSALNTSKIKANAPKANLADYWYYQKLPVIINTNTDIFSVGNSGKVKSVYQPASINITIDGFWSYFDDFATVIYRIMGSNTGGGNISTVSIPVPANSTINGGSTPVTIAPSANPVTVTVVRYKNEFYNKGRFTNDYLVRVG